MAKRGPKPKVDWENIEIEIIPEGEPNPNNPYSRLSPDEREQAILRIYERIYLRIISNENK